MHAWIHGLSFFSLALGAGSAIWLAAAQRCQPEKMPVMVLVWPLAGLFAGPLAIWLHRAKHRQGPKSFWIDTAAATCHCGAGCTLGDLVAESLALSAPALLLAIGPDRIVAGWILDTLLAFLLGIAFQYFTIAPMRGLSPAAGLMAALKADTLSLLAWQAGMIGVMAWVQYGLMRLTPAQPEFWFAMQGAMLAGFAVSYPVNAWLLTIGLKERM